MADKKNTDAKLVDHSYDNTIQFRQMLSAGHRTREVIVTSLLWVVYGYLWLPVISLVAWYYGIDFAYDLVLQAGGPETLIITLIWFSIVTLLVLLVIVTWSGFQYSRFKGKGERRNRVAPADMEAEREFWQIGEALQAQLKSNKTQTISLGTDGRIKSVVNM